MYRYRKYFMYIYTSTLKIDEKNELIYKDSKWLHKFSTFR